jgi:hypothetical protein
MTNPGYVIVGLDPTIQSFLTTLLCFYIDKSS